jgi:hypothetical protein
MAERPSSTPLRKMNQFRNGSVSIKYADIIVNDAVSTINNTTTVLGNTVTNNYTNLSQSIGTTNTNVSQSLSQVTTTLSQSIDSFTLTMASQSVMLSTIEDLALSNTKSTNIHVNKEIPIGSIDGTNSTFILRNIPVNGSEHLYLNGLLIEEGSQTDYTISGSTITFSEPLWEGAKLHCTYYYATETIVRLFADKEAPYGLINGENTTFQLAHEPVLGSEHIYLNGLLQEGSGNDYTLTGNTVVFAYPPETDTRLRCTYYYDI